MIKRILFAAFVLTCTFGKTQNIFENYQDGKIWLKVKDDYKVNLSLSEDPKDLPLNTLPFLNKTNKNFPLLKLSRPFSTVKNSPALFNTYLIEFADPSEVTTLIEALQSNPEVEYVERVSLPKPCLIPNDPDYGSQWHLNKINASLAWNYFSSGSNIVVAIVDDAIERTHSDLSPSLWVNTGDNNNNGSDDDGNGYIDDQNGFDVADGDNNPNPPSLSFDHGTHVAGIVGATANNGIGVASIGYSVKLMCVKATNSLGVITHPYDGVVYAALNKADIINMSWGGPGFSQTEQNIVNWAHAQGCIMIAAAGNDNTSSPFYPAAYDNVIAVAATNSNDTKSNFSNYGNWVDVSAPGKNIYSTAVGNSYGNNSGSSMSAPLVAGLCGLMKSLNPNLTQSDIINCLISTTTNIDGINSTYSGLLGTGRIDAGNAMSCISATLSWPPVADFSVNITTVTAGGQASFTDQSAYNPTSWSWIFAGGTPSSYNGETPPPITYNTPGVYSVSLTASNANGSNTEIKTSYITVNAGGGCKKINYPIPDVWNLTNYTAGTGGADGFINGTNVNDDKQKAMYFDASSTPYTFLTQVYVAFGSAYSSNPNKVVTVKVYNGTSGNPTGLLGSVTTTMGKIMSDVDNSYYTSLLFPDPIALPSSRKFFVSVDISNLSWGGVAKDSLSIISNLQGQTVPSAIWEQQSDNSWHQYGSGGTWALNASLVIHPFLTSVPATATYIQSATSICEGSSIDYDATGSTYEDTLLWIFSGGTPSFSNNVQANVMYNTPGTYPVKLYVIGGGCSQLDSMISSITIKANPLISVSADNTTICPGGSTNLSASGASSYIWNPSNGLSANNKANVTASPSTTTTYNVSGTASNGCSANSNITINVDQPPSVLVTTTSLSVCVGEYVQYDASQSSNVNTFSWNFEGGNPLTASTSQATVYYTSPGSFTTSLNAGNSCGSDSSYNQTINVGCVGIQSNPDGERDWNVFYSALSGNAIFAFKESNIKGMLFIINSLGEKLYEETILEDRITVDFSSFPAGIYVAGWLKNGRVSSKKIVVY